MAYKFFDKRYLVFPDQDCLGKKVFFFDTYKDLIEEVESGDVCRTRTIDGVHKDEVYPFNIDGTNWILAYYDPNYEAKVAYSQGRTIEYRRKGDDEWHISTGGVLDPKYYEYRVKSDKWFVHPSADKYGNCIGQPFYKDTDNKKFVAFEGTEEKCDKWIEEHTPKTRRMTNKELSRWLAEGNGERVDVITKYVSANYVLYAEGKDNEACDEDIRIREWDSDEWHEPLVEVTE